jgi:two-component system response regulator DesR
VRDRRAAATGIRTDQIAVQLSLSHTTVRNYLSNASSMIGARDAGWL